MATVDSFSYGKKGKRLSESEQLVRRLNTYDRKTLSAAPSNHGVNPGQFQTRQAMIVELAFQILKRRAEASHGR